MPKTIDPAEERAKAIIKASKKGDNEAITALLAEDASGVHARDKDGSTPLHCAAWNGHDGTVRLLLDAGADIHARNENHHWGTTALHAAAHGDRRAVVALLLERGADADAQDASGKTPLDHTGFHNARAAAKALREHSAKI